MLVDITLTKPVLCKLNETTKKDAFYILRKKYTSTIIDNHYILEVKKIIDTPPGKMQELGVLYHITFSCMAYKVDIGEEITVKVMNTSHMGTYCYDEIVGKDIASFYLPSVQVDQDYVRVKVIGRRLYDGLLYLVELVKDSKSFDQNKEESE